MKIISWNTNSLRKGVTEKLEKLINEENPDIICFQETKGIEKDIETFLKPFNFLKKFPYRFYNDSVKGQAGVAVWSKIKPVKPVLTEIPNIFQLKNGRILVLEFDHFVILNTYVPNTGREIAENHRKLWHNSLIDWLPNQLEKGFIWCGDLNVVSEPHLDTSHHKIRPNMSKTTPPGLKDFEKEHFDEYLELGLYDVFRHINPNSVSFTWFSMRRNDVGWRLDYF